MSAPAKVVSHAPRDIHVLGGESLIYRIAAGSRDDTPPAVNATARQGISYISYEMVDRSVDYSRRVTTDSHGVILRSNPGSLTIGGSVSTSGFSTWSESVSVQVFDEPDVIIEVADTSELHAAFGTIDAGSNNHYLISMASGTYTFVDCPKLTRTDDYLITFEPDVGALGSVTIQHQPEGANNHIWRLLTFDAVDSAPAFTAYGNSVHVFDTCKFSGGSYGIYATPSSYVRAVGCHTVGCASGFRDVSVIRSCSGTLLTKVFAYDCSVVDGCLVEFESGNGDSFIRLSRNFSTSVAITNNTLVDQADVKFIASESPSLESSLITGNVASTAGPCLVSMDYLRSSIFAHNTLHTTDPSGHALVLSKSASSNSFTNNWLYPLTRKAVKGTQFQSNWKQNATGSDTTLFPNTLTGLEDQFANNYMFPKKRSQLLNVGEPTTSLFSQGVKAKGQIGALPFTDDTDLTYVHRSVIDRPFFNFSGPTPVT